MNGTTPAARHLRLVPPPSNAPTEAVLRTAERIRARLPEFTPDRAAFFAAWIHGLTGAQASELRAALRAADGAPT